MRSYLASLALKCKSSNKEETTAGNTLLLPTSSPGRFCLALGEKRPGHEVVLLLVLIVGNRIILKPSSVGGGGEGVGVSKLVPFSRSVQRSLFASSLPSPSPFYAFFPTGDPGQRLQSVSTHDTEWGRGTGPDPLLGIRNDLSVT